MGQSCSSFCATTGRTCNLEGTKVDSEDEFKAVYDNYNMCADIYLGTAYTTSPSLEGEGECYYNSEKTMCDVSWYDGQRWCVCDGGNWFVFVVDFSKHRKVENQCYGG